MENELLGAKLDLIGARIQVLEGKIDTRPKENWRTSLVQLIGIPLALIALATQFYQIRTSAPAETDKTIAETAKLRAEELQTRAELQQTLDNLAAQRAQGVTAYQKALTDALPTLERTVDKIGNFNRTETARLNQSTFTKFVVFYLVWMSIGLFFNALTTFWGAVIVAVQSVGNETLSHKKWFRVARSLLVTTLYVPQMLWVYVQLFMLVRVAAPWFNELTMSIGQSTEFGLLWARITSFQFAAVAEMVRAILLSS